jgi:hypothetical protein
MVPATRDDQQQDVHAIDFVFKKDRVGDHALEEIIDILSEEKPAAARNKRCVCMIAPLMRSHNSTEADTRL